MAASANRLRHLWLQATRLAAAFALSAAAVFPAAALTVTSLADSGAGSLRDAVTNTPDGGTVDFLTGLAGTITLSSGEIAFAKSLTIDGAGATVAVSGSNARIFNATDGTTTFTVRNLKLVNGRANAGSMRGGAIATNGALVAEGVWLSGNQAVDGGGAIYVGRAAGTLGSATIRNSAFSGNSVTGSGGVGGGAILVAGDASGPSVASLTLLNTTISGNSANASLGMAGGGIAIATATLTLISSTVAGNDAGAAGADLHQGTLANTAVTLTNSVVGAGTLQAALFDAPDRDLYQPGGMGSTSGGHNVVQQPSGATFAGTDVTGADPQLGALGNNGGPTPTQALGAASPARDLVPLASCVDDVGAPLMRDQRNGARQTAGNLCDAGAFEVQFIVLSPASVPNGTVGTPYSQTFTPTGGVGTISFTLGGSLPAGLGLDPVTGVLSGTPTAAGTFNFTVTASDAFGGSSGAVPYSITVDPGPPAKLFFLQQPTSTTAGSAIAPSIVVQVRDAFDNPVPTAAGSVTLAIGNNPGGSTLSGPATQPLAGGAATFAGLSLNKSGAGYTLIATSGALPPLPSSAFNIAAGAPASLVFVQQPTNTAAGNSIAPAITVQILDALGNLTASAANVTLAIASNPGGGTLSGTSTVAAVSGTATFGNLSIDKVGTGYTLAASSAGLPGMTSGAFNILVGAASKLLYGQSPSNTAVGAPITPAITVQITDALGNVTTSTANVTIAIGANPGGGALSGTLTVAAVGGTATFANLSIDKTGVGYTLAASSAGLIGATSAPFNIVAGAADHLVFGQQPTTVTAGSAIAPAVTVQIVDSLGNLTSSTATVIIGIGANPGGSTLSGTLSVAAVNGTATFSNLSLNKPATGYTLAATSAGLTGATSTSFDVVAGVPTHLAFVQQPSSSGPGVTIVPPVTVQLLDALDNVVNSGATVTLAIGTNPSGGALSGPTSVAANAGTATFSGLSIDKTGAGYTLVASSGVLPAVTSAAFDISNRLLTVPLPGGGVVTVALGGGGGACSFASGGFVPLTGGPGSPPAGSAPAGYSFPYGLANFTATPCTGAVTLTYTFPAPLPASTAFWKYGPTAATPAAHWYTMPAVISGNTAVVTIADGGLGDDDLTIDGTIIDPAGVGLPVGLGAAIPTLGPPALALLMFLLGALALMSLRRRRR